MPATARGIANQGSFNAFIMLRPASITNYKSPSGFGDKITIPATPETTACQPGVSTFCQHTAGKHLESRHGTLLLQPGGAITDANQNFLNTMDWITRQDKRVVAAVNRGADIKNQ